MQNHSSKSEAERMSTIHLKIQKRAGHSLGMITIRSWYGAFMIGKRWRSHNLGVVRMHLRAPRYLQGVRRWDLKPKLAAQLRKMIKVSYTGVIVWV